ncbi:SMP-30/gluconolactonase/LRE family protein [Olivibacter sp. SDN3]|nr:SMP-30/gluconolactonase/LRE family protein [Olivibacter sp. SDN3]
MFYLKLLAVTGICCFFTCEYLFAQSASVGEKSLIAPQAELKLIDDHFAFTEGPSVDKRGNVYFTDQPNNRIWKYDTYGKLSLFMDNAGRANGMFFDKKGQLIVCADEQNQLWRIKKDRSVDTLVLHYQDTLLNGPNDVWVSPRDFIYFTDPYYQRDYWTREQQNLLVRALYLYTPEGKVIRLDGDFKQPNGIIGSADGKLLYVADIGDNKTYRYSIQQDGSLTDKALFVNQGSDGMTIDEHGNVYLTGDGVTVYDRWGKKINHIPVPAKWTANVCFGGKKRDQLFITASESVYTLKMAVKGVQ